jgi:hypothetical protein
MSSTTDQSTSRRLNDMTNRKRIKAVVGAIALLLTLGLTLVFSFPSTALAWDNCPYGLVNDPYPGRCGRYTDTNGDNICDLSQSAPVTTTTKQTVTTTTLAVATTTSGEPPTGDCPLGPCTTCQACTTTTITDSASAVDVAAVGGALIAASGSDTTSTTTPGSGGSGDATGTASVAAAATAAESGTPFLTHYLVSPIALGFLLIYGLSFFLYKTKRIRVATHRKIWNVLLLATFLITGIFGVLLAIQLDYTLPFTIPINMLFWHVEAGIVMTFISLFHMGWHFNYYRNMLRTSRAKVRAARAAERTKLAGERQLVLEAREQRRADREARRVERERAAQWQRGTGPGGATPWERGVQPVPVRETEGRRSTADPRRPGEDPLPTWNGLD